MKMDELDWLDEKKGEELNTKLNPAGIELFKELD